MHRVWIARVFGGVLLLGAIVGRPFAVLQADRACAEATRLHWSPEIPQAGSLLRITLTRTDQAQLSVIRRAQLAGEPLHFRRVGDSALAYAAAPVDSTRGLTLTITCDNDIDVSTRLPTRAGAYPLEKLSVAHLTHYERL